MAEAGEECKRLWVVPGLALKSFVVGFRSLASGEFRPTFAIWLGLSGPMFRAGGKAGGATSSPAGF